MVLGCKYEKKLKRIFKKKINSLARVSKERTMC